MSIYCYFSKSYHSFTKTFLESTKLFIIGTSLVVTGCASVDNGSLEKRSLLLATGIHKAYSVETTTAQRIAPMILQHAEQYDVDPLLLAAMIRQESSYRSGVISPAGAVGLTQVIPRYWQQTCQGDLFDENTNIQCGTFILAKYNKSAGSWKKALAYYNVGPTGYHSSWKMKRQGNRYAEQVEEHQKQLKNEL